MLSRRSALQSLAAAPMALAQSQSTKPKNVLLIMCDEHRPHALGIDGDPLARTPNLDALARESVRFRNAYCSSPVCVPSRFSLMTGMWPHRGKVWGNLNPWPAEFPTMGDLFTKAGYATANIGKLHAVEEGKHGFQLMLDQKEWFEAIGPQKAQIWKDELRANTDRKGTVHPGKISTLPEEDHFESWVARESIRFLQANRTRPFFLVSSLIKPHDPFMPAERFAKLYPMDKATLPSTWGKLDVATVPEYIRTAVQKSPHTPELLDREMARKRVGYYYANLMQSDDRIGAILGELKRLGLENDTIVVYTSDHGDMVGDKGLWLKFIMYENSVGVPLMFRVPGMTRGSRCENIASLTQILPTLAELCGLALGVKTDGPSLVPSLREPGKRVDSFAYSEISLNAPRTKQMLRRGDYKFVLNGRDMDQLFDMRSDPDEMTNLALDGQHKEIVERMKAETLAIYTPRQL